MSRHGLTADNAFEMLRAHSQNHGRKLIDVADAVVESHLLLSSTTTVNGPRQSTDRSRFLIGTVT